MSEIKISALPPASSANPSDVVAIVQDGVTKKLPISAITGNVGGWQVVDSFEAGATLTTRNQALRYAATGDLYRWDGALPKAVAPGSTPSSSGGTGVGAWLLIIVANNEPYTPKEYATVNDMKAGDNPAGSIARCSKYKTDSPLWPSLIYTSRGAGWPIVADGYVNHSDINGNFLELMYDVLDVRQAGAVGDGDTVDTTPVQKCVDYLQTLGGGQLNFTRGVFKIGKINAPTVPMVFNGNDAKLIPATASTQTGISKESRGGRIEVNNLSFSGFKRAVNIVMPTSEEMFYDFLITRCKFTQVPADGWGIYLDGPREGNIDKCYFESFGGGLTSGGGIYRTLTVNTNIRDCIFKELRFGVYDDGQGSPYSAGNHLLGCAMLGVNFGITVSRGDSYVIDGCMIDYCDVPIRLFSQDGAKIINNYLSSRTASPVIDVKKDPADAVGNFGIKIINNTVITHHTASEVNCIEMFNSQDSSISDNYLQFFNRYGVRYGSCNNMSIDKNTFAPRPGSPYETACIANTDGTSNTSNRAVYNSFQGVALSPLNQNIIARHNSGLITQAFGVATIPAGGTTVTVTHGMGIEPAIVLMSPQTTDDIRWQFDGTTGITFVAAASNPSARNVSWVAYTAYAIIN